MITFGLITNSGHHENSNIERLNKIIDSIEATGADKYEIIIVGDNAEEIDRKNVHPIAFDDNIKKGWITRKKNIITENAKNDVIVFSHDYITYDKNWWKGWMHYGFQDWDLAMNVMINKDGTRFRDWCVFKFDGNQGANGVWANKSGTGEPYAVSPYIPRYDYKRTDKMYISGSYWVAKKKVMEEEPLDEQFVWGQPEDIEWSDRVLRKYKYIMNPYCAVNLMHQKDNVWSPLIPRHVTAEYIAETHGYYWDCRKLVD